MPCQHHSVSSKVVPVPLQFPNHRAALAGAEAAAVAAAKVAATATVASRHQGQGPGAPGAEAPEDLHATLHELHARLEGLHAGHAAGAIPATPRIKQASWDEGRGV